MKIQYYEENECLSGTQLNLSISWPISKSEYILGKMWDECPFTYSCSVYIIPAHAIQKEKHLSKLA